MIFEDLHKSISSIETNIALLEEYWEATLPTAWEYISELRLYIEHLREVEETRPSKASEC